MGANPTSVPNWLDKYPALEKSNVYEAVRLNLNLWDPGPIMYRSIFDTGPKWSGAVETNIPSWESNGR